VGPDAERVTDTSGIARSTHRDIKANGVRLRVALSGTGPPVVLLHGLFTHHGTWDAVVDEMSSEFRLIALDFPGFGESEKPPESRFAYDVGAFAEVVADLFAGLDIGRAAVVGHALGGATPSSSRDWCSSIQSASTRPSIYAVASRSSRSWAGSS